MVPSSILVLGLGELGHEVVRSLAEHDHRDGVKLAVMLRKSANTTKRKQQDALLSEWNVSIIEGDVVEEPVEQLTEKFRHFHAIICCLGMYAPPSTQVKIAQAVIAANIPHYFPWQFGIDYDIIGRNSSQNLFDSQLDVRDLLRSQKSTKCTIVSTGIFISFLFEPSFGLVNAERDLVTGIGNWDNEITATSPQDIGRVAAELALVYPDTEGVVYVSGDTISMSRLADVVEKVKGKGVERKLKTVEDLKGELVESPEDGMRKYRVVFAEGKGTAWAIDESFNAKIGMVMESVEEWAERNL